MCSFRFDKAWKLFIYGFNKEKLLESNALRRLKMLFQRPWISGEACPRTPLAARAFGDRDCPPSPPPPKKNLTFLRHCYCQINTSTHFYYPRIIQVPGCTVTRSADQNRPCFHTGKKLLGRVNVHLKILFWPNRFHYQNPVSETKDFVVTLRKANNIAPFCLSPDQGDWSV